MAREICTFKWQDKSVRLNEGKSVPLNGRTKVYV